MEFVHEGRLYDDDDMVDASAWLRAARRARRLSQRELAARAGLPCTTVARAESNRHAPRLSTFVSLLAAAGYGLVLVDLQGRPLLVDEEHDRIRDAADRRLPAHLYWDQRPNYIGRGSGWWGWHRIAWLGSDVPEHVWFMRPRRTVMPRGSSSGREYGYVWDDAT